MKKLLICLSAIAVIACKEEPKDYVTLAGKIANKNSDSLFVYQGRQFSKTIKVNEDGTFSDTLKVVKGMYGIYDGNESTNVFLKNGYDLNLTLDTKEFDESIKFSGNGAESNNYLVKKALMQENLINPSIFDLDEDEFKKKVAEIETEMNGFLENNNNGLDSMLVANEKLQISQFNKGISGAYKQQKARATQFADFIGKPSPDFVNYENVKGGTTSLADLKGKYVYIDVWATWCGPCIREIPSLKEIEKDFHDKNIEFVSLSVDDGRGFKGDAAAAKEGWKKMIKEKELGGIQILSDKGWKSDFVQGYKINGIPRFILIDPAGNVVNADAPRPSSSKLRELLNGLENI
ncbi:TlpA disulfide reductase family protein [uncultured Lacinutrix sp.]|uniref:TlpA family protein disulfide reductase n=1 Tax=uncultured Lacinutrix sp. TaxID=574032 RepID=UPI0026174BCA|nr:TlpA disulfide reductase family protein [uncultured Lacinutrix sp.]